MSNPLNDALESAFVIVISAGVGASANVYPGKFSGTKVLPEVICAADGSSQEEDPPHSGNFWVDVEITIRAMAAIEPDGIDPKPDDAGLVSLVWSLIKVDNLDALLNATGQPLTVFPRGYFFLSPKTGKDAEGAWIDSLPIRVYCCNQVLPP